jgi:hypothetical protein
VSQALESVVRRLGVELSQLHGAQLQRDVEMERKYAAELAGKAAELERVQRECEAETHTMHMHALHLLCVHQCTHNAEGVRGGDSLRRVRAPMHSQCTH